MANTKVQLFIKDPNSTWVEADMFDDQRITFINNLKDIRDIKKVFTDFTRQFRIPASKTNNIMLKHYDNWEVDNGYDGRVRGEAALKINGGDYRKGNISMKGVDMRHGRAFAYRMVFFGKMVTLNELIGDDELSVLGEGTTSYLADFDHLQLVIYVLDLIMVLTIMQILR